MRGGEEIKDKMPSYEYFCRLPASVNIEPGISIVKISVFKGKKKI